MMSLAASPGPDSKNIQHRRMLHYSRWHVKDATRRALVIRDRILRGIGIPCIGIAQTKTLAKLANHVAKDSETQTGQLSSHLQRVRNLPSCRLGTAVPAGVHASGRCEDRKANHQAPGGAGRMHRHGSCAACLQP